MKSNKTAFLLGLLVVSCLLVSCASNYYDKFGGYPLESEELAINDEAEPFKLLVTYRYAFQAGSSDTTSLNISINPMLSQPARQQIFISRLVLASKDSTYLYSISNPAIFGTYGKFPVSVQFTDAQTGETYSSSDQPSVFTVSRNSPTYELSLHYKVLIPDRTWQDKRKSFPIDISGITRKTGLDNPVFMQD